MTDCVRCNRPVADTGFACHSCATGLAVALLRAATQSREIVVTVARLDRIGTGGGSTVVPLAFAWDASVAARSVYNTVVTWTRHIAHERGGGIPTDRRVIAWLMWLAGQVGWLRMQPYADEAFDELHYAVTLLRRTIDLPPALWYAGTCWAADDEGTRCAADLYAHSRADVIICRQCGTPHDAAYRKQWLLNQARDQLGHAGLLATALAALGIEVRANTISQWHHRGLILDHGRNPRGWPVYRVGDVLDLAERLVRKGELTPA